MTTGTNDKCAAELRRLRRIERAALVWRKTFGPDPALALLCGADAKLIAALDAGKKAKP